MSINLFVLNAIPDTVRDENIDIHRVEKYYRQTDGMQYWKLFIKKRKAGGRVLLAKNAFLKKKVVLSVKDT